MPTVTVEEMKTEIRKFLARFFRNRDLQDDEDLFSLGFVNSLFAMQLVLFVEKQFSVTIEREDVNVENFRSINALVQLIERKRAAVAHP